MLNRNHASMHDNVKSCPLLTCKLTFLKMPRFFYIFLYIYPTWIDAKVIKMGRTVHE